MYVKTQINALLVKLVSHFLSSSTLLFLFFILSISFFYTFYFFFLYFLFLFLNFFPFLYHPIYIKYTAYSGTDLILFSNPKFLFEILIAYLGEYFFI